MNKMKMKLGGNVKKKMVHSKEEKRISRAEEGRSCVIIK